jgi:protease YdgD
MWGDSLIGSAFIRSFVVFISLLLAGVPLQADQKHVEMSPPPQDPVVGANDYPWSAVGKLNNGAFGSCSAVLISHQYALTAAHCLFFKYTRRFLPAQALHLVFGFEHGNFRDHLHVSAYHVPPAYDPLRPYETLAHDWALLEIAKPLKMTTRPLSMAQDVSATAIMNLMTAGYAKRTPYRMTADRQCHFVGRTEESGLLFDSCESPEGFSGGPVLVENADHHSFSVVGIHIGNQVWQGKVLAISISSDAIWRAIKPCIENKACQFQHVATGQDPTAAEVLSGLPNLDDKYDIELTSTPPLSGR